MNTTQTNHELHCIGWTDNVVEECYLFLRYVEDSDRADAYHDLVYDKDESQKFMDWLAREHPEVCTKSNKHDETHWQSPLQYNDPQWTLLAREYLDNQ